SRIIDCGSNSGNMNLAFGAKSLQPGNQQLADFLLSEQLTNFAGNFRQWDLGSSSLLQLGNELVAVVGFDGLGIDLNRWAQAGINQAHDFNLLTDMSEEIFLSQLVAIKNGLPTPGRGALRIQLARLGNAYGHFIIGGMRKVSRLHLFAKKFPIYQAIQDGAAIAGI